MVRKQLAKRLDTKNYRSQPVILFIQTLALLLCLSLRLEAQPKGGFGVDQESGCWINNGAAVTTYDIAAPSATRTFPGLRLHYSSASGWSFDLPYITSDRSDGELYFYDGACRSRLYRDSTTGYWRTATGGKFSRDAQNLSFTFHQANGSTVTFGQYAFNGTRYDVLLPTVVSDFFGWKSTYQYRSGFPSQLESVSVDTFGNRSQEFTFNVNYDNSNRPDVIQVLSKTGQLLLDHDLQYGGEHLQAISQRSGRGNVLWTTSFEYHSTGTASGLLQKKITPFGGEVIFDYESVNVVDSAGNTPHPLVVLSSVEFDPNTDSQSSEIFRYSFREGVYDGERFFGFRKLEKSSGSTGVEERIFRTSGRDEVGILEKAHLYGPGKQVLFSESHLFWGESSDGANLRIAPEKLVRVKREPSVGTSTVDGIEIFWDLVEMRPSMIHYHQQSDFDFTTESFGSAHPEDDRVVVYMYRSESSDSPKRNEIERSLIRDHRGVAVSELQIEFDATSNLPHRVKEWNSETNQFVETDFTYDSFGNINSLTTESGSFAMSWNGLRPRNIRIDPAGENHTFTFTYDDKTGLTRTVTEPDGNSRRIDYDQFHRTERETLRSFGNAEEIVLAEIRYQTTPAQIERETFGSTVTYALDGFGRTVKTSRPDRAGSATVDANTLQMNGLGQVARTSIPSFLSASADVIPGESSQVHSQSYRYDAIGRVAGISADSFGNGIGRTDLFYFGQGTAGSPPLNPQARASIDDFTYIHQSGYFSNTKYHHYGFGPDQTTLAITSSTRRKELVDGLGNRYLHETDSLGRTTHLNPPLGSAFDVTYKSNLRPDEITFQSGKKESYQTDSLGRNTSITYSNPMTQEHEAYYFQWDSPTYSGFRVRDGLLASIRGPRDAVHFDYDHFGRIAQAVHVHFEAGGDRERTFGFQYDYQSGALKRIYYPENAAGSNYVEYEFDSSGLEKSIYANHILSVDPTGILRDIRARDPEGRMTNVEYYNDIRETYLFHSTSGAMSEMNVSRISSGRILESKRYQYSGSRLYRKDVFLNGTSGYEEYSEVDSRGFFTQIKRKIGSEPEQVLNYSWDSAGRQMGDPTSGFQYLYDNVSSHPYELDALAKEGIRYPFSYNADDQLAGATGPAPENNLRFTYGPDTEVRTITNSAGATITFERSVFGDLLRATVRDPNGEIQQVYRKFLLGLYEEEYHRDHGETHIVNVYGELSRGGEGRIARFRYNAPSAGNSSLAANGGPGQGSTKAPKDPAPRAGTICGNGVLEPGEQCERDADCPGLSTCSKACTCIPGGPPPPIIEIEIGTVAYDENGDIIIDERTAAILVYLSLLEEFANRTRSFPGFSTTTSTECDQIDLTTSEGTIPTLVVSAASEAQARGLEAFGMNPQYQERWVESPVEQPEEEDGWFFFIVHTGLDVVGCFDPVGICDGANAVIYLVRGRYTDAGISALSMIPIVGDAAKSTRAGQRVCKTVADVAQPVADAAKNVAGKTGEVILKTAGRTKGLLRTITTRTGRYSCGDLSVVLGDWSHYIKIAEQGKGKMALLISPELFEKYPEGIREQLGRAVNRQFIEFAAFLQRNGGAKIELNTSQPLSEIFGVGMDRGLGREVHDLIVNHGYSFRRAPKGTRRGFFVQGRGAAENRLSHFYNNACEGMTRAPTTYSPLNPWGGTVLSPEEISSVLRQSFTGDPNAVASAQNHFDAFMTMR